VPEPRADELVRRARADGAEGAAVIGEVVERQAVSLVFRA
jgi:hypothetical protein